MTIDLGGRSEADAFIRGLRHIPFAPSLGDVPTTLSHPATTSHLANGNWVRDPFPGNRIPLNRFDPVARKVLDLDPWVLPNQAGSFTTTGPARDADTC